MDLSFQFIFGKVFDELIRTEIIGGTSPGLNEVVDFLEDPIFEEVDDGSTEEEEDFVLTLVTRIPDLAQIFKGILPPEVSKLIESHLRDVVTAEIGKFMELYPKYIFDYPPKIETWYHHLILDAKSEDEIDEKKTISDLEKMVGRTWDSLVPSECISSDLILSAKDIGLFHVYSLLGRLILRERSYQISRFREDNELYFSF